MRCFADFVAQLRQTRQKLPEVVLPARVAPVAHDLFDGGSAAWERGHVLHSTIHVMMRIAERLRGSERGRVRGIKREGEGEGVDGDRGGEWGRKEELEKVHGRGSCASIECMGDDEIVPPAKAQLSN